MIAYFLSDIHLIDGQEKNSLALFNFINSIPSLGGTHLFLVGDIFDLWISDHHYFQNRFKNLIDAITNLTSLGIEVHYFEGNHDLYINDFWATIPGVNVHLEPAQFQLGSYRVRVEHGDLMNKEDRGYLFLKSLLQSSIMKLIAKRLPGFIVSFIGERMSRASRSYTSHQKYLPEVEIIKFMRAHAIAEYNLRPFDFLICGHTHVKHEEVIEQGEFKLTLINLGSWFDFPKAFVLKEDRSCWIEISSVK